VNYKDSKLCYLLNARAYMLQYQLLITKLLTGKYQCPKVKGKLNLSLWRHMGVYMFTHTH